MAYHVGDLIRASATFTSAAGTAVDPTVVLAKYKDPGGVTVSLTYGAVGSEALVRDSAGNYHVDIDADEAGFWQYRFYSTGTGRATSATNRIAVYPNDI